MLQLLEFQVSVTPEQLVMVLLEAQSGKLVMHMVAAYSKCCGMPAPVSVAGLISAGGGGLPGYVAMQLPCWEGPGAAVHGQHIFQQQQQLIQQLGVGAAQRKRRSNSLEVMEGVETCRPKVFCGRTSMEVMA